MNKYWIGIQGTCKIYILHSGGRYCGQSNLSQVTKSISWLRTVSVLLFFVWIQVCIEGILYLHFLNLPHFREICKRLSFSEIQSSKWHSYRCVYESGAAKALVVQTRQSAVQASVVQPRPGAPFFILFILILNYFH